MQTVGVSQRQACSLLGIWRGTCRYQAKGDGENDLIRQRLRDLAVARPRFGSPRLVVLLRRELGVINHKRVERLYAEEGLQLPKRRKKLRRSFSRVIPEETPTGPLQRWSMDFMSDELFDGRRIRLIRIVDNFTRESLAIEVEARLGGTRVVEVLNRLNQERGRPKTIRVDNGPEFTSKRLDQRAYLNGVELDFSRPAKPTDNAFIEAFNGRGFQWTPPSGMSE